MTKQQLTDSISQRHSCDCMSAIIFNRLILKTKVRNNFSALRGRRVVLSYSGYEKQFNLSHGGL